MKQLTEVSGVRQDPDEPHRRWFWSNNMELMVWLNEGGSPIGFQLSYDKDRGERVLTWTAERGFSHTAVDDGEEDIGFRHKATPILIADGYFEADRVLKTFEAFSDYVPLEMATFVMARLKEHPNYEVRA